MHADCSAPHGFSAAGPGCERALYLTLGPPSARIAFFAFMHLTAPTISRIIATRAKIITGHAKIAMSAAPAAADVQLARCSMPYGSSAVAGHEVNARRPPKSVYSHWS